MQVRPVLAVLGSLLLFGARLVAAPAIGSTPSQLFLLDDQPDTGFGEGISGLGDTNGDGFDDFAVCAPRVKLPGGGQGEVRVFLGGRGGVAGQAALTLRPPTASEGFGFRVAGGDLNHDGYGDAVILGLPPRGTSGVSLALWVSLGSASGLQPPSDVAYSAPTTSGPAGFGFIGDVNGDGFPDLAVGLPSVDGDTGEVLVFHGNAAVSWPAPSTRITPTQRGEYFGFFCPSRGDFNRDGFDDLVVGSTHYEQWSAHNGHAQLFLGSRDGIQTNATWVATYPLSARPDIDSNHHQYFGNFIVLDDFNGDGLSDAVITAPFSEKNDPDEGIVFGYYGTLPAPGMPSAFDWSVQANRPHAVLGLMAERAGDVNGDGFPDLLLGAPDFGNGQLREGLVALFLGSRHGLATEPVWTLESQDTHCRLGTCGAGVGDLNGDGFDELVVSQVETGVAPFKAGGIRVIYGAASGPAGSTKVAFAKPAFQWLAEEWRRLSGLARTLVGGTSMIAFGLLGIAGRQFWRKRTIMLMDQRERTSRAEERERLARDLHDELGSRLSRIHLIAEMVREDPDYPGAIRTVTDTLSQEAKDMRTAIEQLASSLEPRADTTDGLVRALSQHANSFFSGTPVRCFQDLPVELPSVQLSEDVRAELFPCVREALANVLRHSQASEVWFKVRWDTSLLKISLEDNGVGFLPSTATTGNGLRNFRARMARIGGKVEVRSSPGRGTEVSFEVPGSQNEGHGATPGIGLPSGRDAPKAEAP